MRGHSAGPDEILETPIAVQDDLSWARHRIEAVAAGVERSDVDDSARAGFAAILKDVAERLDELEGDA